jgi:shikimate kinase
MNFSRVSQNGENRLNRDTASIFLTGFSGTGKTTIGKSLAFKMDRPFIDLDSEVELLSGYKIDTLIETQGLAAFRSLEAQILNSLSLMQSSIVALGGGSLISHSSLNQVLNSGFLVYLESSVERIRKNLTTIVGRPLLKNYTTETIEILMRERQSGYEQANMTLAMDGLSILETSDAVYEGYKKWQKRLI